MSPCLRRFTGSIGTSVGQQDYRAFGYEPSYETLPWKDEYVE